MPGWLAAAVPSLIGLAGSIFGRSQSQGDIAKQNAYNHPVNQVARLKAAGLPMAAIGNNVSGTQSNLPETSGDKMAGAIAEGTRTTQTMLATKMLEEQIRAVSAQADLTEAQRDWLMSGKGEDTAGTNLTANMKTEQGLLGAQGKGAELANQIHEVAARNAETKTGLENEKARQDIRATILGQLATGTNIEGAELENRLKQIELQYRPSMSNAELEGLLKRNQLTVVNISLDKLRLALENRTFETNVQIKDMEAALKELAWSEVSEKFKDYKQYMTFVQGVQDEMHKTPWEKITDPIGTFNNMVNMIYTTVVGPSGQTNTNLLNYIK